MDLNDYWQENKRFVTTVAVGLVVFLVARQSLSSSLESGIASAKRSISKAEAEKRELVYTSSDLTEVRLENEALVLAVESLGEALRFRPRADFALVEGGGSPSNQYLRTLSRVREELLLEAGRGDLALDPSLGMPKLSPTRDEEIVRHLEALDVVDQLVRASIRAGVDEIDRIQLRLDPGLGSRQGLGQIERTRLEFRMRGTSGALVQVLRATQGRRGPGTDASLEGRVLPIDGLEITPSRSKAEEVRMDLTLVLPRLDTDAALPIEDARS